MGVAGAGLGGEKMVELQECGAKSRGELLLHLAAPQRAHFFSDFHTFFGGSAATKKWVILGEKVPRREGLHF